MNTENRIRDYLRRKAENLDIEAKPAALAQPSARIGRGRVVALAAVAALIVVGAPLVVLSQVTDDPTTEELAATTLSPSTTVVVTTSTTVTTTIATDESAPTPGSCGTAAVRSADTVVAFYGSCADDPGVPYPVHRPGAMTVTLEQSLSELLGGTTPDENNRGIHAPFDSIDRSDEVEVIATVDDAWIAHVELFLDGAPWVADTGSWSSDQLISLLDSLQSTVFLQEDIAGLDMTALCFEQVACDRTVTRAEWAGILFTNTGTIVQYTCSLEQAWIDPGRCTLDGVLAGTTFSGTVSDIRADDTLKVRAGPGTEYFILDELNLGDQVVVTNATSPASDGGLWRIVDSATSEPGWVNASFLDIVEE
ncbi:MAG: SH3 domain-containing protein [bacterium]|nr:SH3 domain-containing protein [bacterium]